MGLGGRGRHSISILAACLTASGAVAQDRQYREREVLDPNTNEWKVAASQSQPAESTIEQARELLARSKLKAAEKGMKRWLKDNPGHERYYEGAFLLGEALFLQSDFYHAYEQYDRVSDNSAGELFQAALRRDLDVARAFLSGQKRIVWRIFRLSAYDEAVQILDRVWERAPGARIGEQALKLKADFHFRRGDLDLAQDDYVNLARQYPNGRYYRGSLLRSAESAQAAFPGTKFDDHALIEADQRYRELQKATPEFARQNAVDQRLEGIRQQRAEKDLDVARWYEKTRQPGAAEFYYKLILKEWPDTLAATSARTRLRALGVETNEGSPAP